MTNFSRHDKKPSKNAAKPITKPREIDRNLQPSSFIKEMNKALLIANEPKLSDQILLFLSRLMLVVFMFFLIAMPFLSDEILSKLELPKFEIAPYIVLVVIFIITVFIIVLMRKESEQALENISKVNQRLVQIASEQSVQVKESYQDTLRKKYLAISNPYIYYTDSERLTVFYNKITGRQSLEKLISRTGQELKGEAKAGVKNIVYGGVDGKITENREEEVRVREPSILEMLLDVQTHMLKNDLITLGIEKGLVEGKFRTSEPNVSATPDLTIYIERRRLKDLKGLILVKMNFTMRLSEPDQSHYILNFTRPMVENSERSPLVTFNTSFPRNSLAEKDKYMFEKKLDSTIELILFGHVTSSEDSGEGNISIDIAPYAIYLP